jgi:Domain of unknown function (DUF4936)
VSGHRTELYVYYRVAGPHCPAARQVVHGFQRQLCDRHPGLNARVLRRPAETGDGVTLMEIYTIEREGGIDATLQAHIEAAAAALTPMLASPRQVERFNPLD